MKFDESNYQQYLVALFLEFLSLPDCEQMYQECLANGKEPHIFLRDDEKTLAFPVKLFTY
jgi:hypothetical protein